MVLKIHCNTLNIKLPPEGVFDSTCGYHALRNGVKMLKLLDNLDLKINKNYLNKINNCFEMNDLKSKNSLLQDIEIYKNVYKSSLLSRSDLKRINKKLKLSKNLYIIYPESESVFDAIGKKKLTAKLKRNNYRFCIIYFEQYFAMTHWVPVIFDKNKDNLYIHILDSYDYVWYGNKMLNKIIDEMYPENKIIKCVKGNNLGLFIFFGYKTLQVLVIIITFYLFIGGLFV
tara:strand:+ start:89 stop:775 length:687 start_codon:yes stop_codon:yes gene_type:complete